MAYEVIISVPAYADLDNTIGYISVHSLAGFHCFKKEKVRGIIL